MANKKIKGLTVMVEGDSTNLKKAIKDSLSEFNQMEQAVRNVDKALKLDPTNIELLNSKQKLLTKSIDESKKSLKELKDYQKQLDEQGGNVQLTKEYTDLQRKIVETENALKKYKSQLTSLPPEVQALTVKMDSLAKNFDKVSEKTRALSAASATTLVAATKTAMSYETQIAEIKKVISDLSDETVESLKEVAKETATTTDAFEEISTYATIAATLGVAEENLRSFAKTMKDLAVATNNGISGEEGAKQVARYLNVFNIGAEYAGNLGSSLTFVGDQFAATADEILETASRMTGLSVINGITQNSLIGLAAELKNIGVETESGASAITKAFMSIETNVATNGDELKAFAKTAGMTSKEFSDAWDGDAMGTFLKFTDGLKSSVFNEISAEVEKSSSKVSEFSEVLGMTASSFSKSWSEDAQSTFAQYIDALGNMSEESESASAILSEVKLSGVRVSQALLKLAGNGNTVKKAIADANKAWDENTALTAKASAVYETTSANISSTFEALKQAGEKVGKVLLPIFNTAVDKVGDLAEQFSQADSEVIKFTTGMLAVGAVISPTTKIMSNTIGTVSDLTKAYGKLKSKLSDTTWGFSKFSTIAGGLPSILGGVGLAIGAVAGATYLCYQYVKKHKSANLELTESLREQQKALEELKITSEENYANSLASIYTGEQYATTIDTLLEKLKEENLTNEQAIETKRLLKAQIDLLNQTVGETAFAYDEETGNLSYLGDVVDSAKNKYAELQAEMKKQAWLEANYDVYVEAQKMMQENSDRTAEIINNYQQAMAGASEELKKIFNNHYFGDADGLKTSVDEYISQLSQLSVGEQIYSSKLISSWLDMNNALSEQNKLLADATKTIENYESITSSENNKAVELIAQLRTLGELDLGIDKLQEHKKELEEQIEITQALAKATTDIDFSDTMAQLQQDLTTTNQAIVGARQAEILAMEDTIFDSNEQSVGEMAQIIQETYGEKIPPAMIDPTLSALENIKMYWEQMVLSDKKVNVYVDYIYSDKAPVSSKRYSNSSNSNGAYENISPYSMRSVEKNDYPIALALNDDYKSTSVAEQIDSNLSMMAASLLNSENAREARTNTQTNNFKIEFNITNTGKEMTNYDVRNYADEIVKIVNEKIGRMI